MSLIAVSKMAMCYVCCRMPMSEMSLMAVSKKKCSKQNLFWLWVEYTYVVAKGFDKLGEIRDIQSEMSHGRLEWQ